MRIILLLLLSTLVHDALYAQGIGIGTNTPNTSALLDITSTNKGLLPPRMTTVQMNAIVAPAAGLIIYNTTDSSYYTKRPGGWTKMSHGQDNVWKHFATNIIYSPTNSYVGINYSDLAASNLIGSYAPLQTRGTIGNTLALFGEDKQGMSLVANYPGIFFNSYFNNGSKAISAGATGNITLNQANPPYYEFSFGDYASSNDQALNNQIQMALRNDGHVYVGNSNLNFSRAAFEQQGSASATAAIFGGDGAGISLQKNWPAIGFNSYLDGAGHKSIQQGYGAQMGLNQQNGSLYLVSFPFNANANTAFNSYIQRFYVSRFGRIGLGTDDPVSDIHIITRDYTDLTDGPDMGFTMEATGGLTGFPSQNVKWNLHTGWGKLGTFQGPGVLNFLINYGSGWINAAQISTDGTYYQASDQKMKKNISYLSSSNLMEKIIQLKPASYNMKDDREQHPLHYGFIVQDVEKIFPEFVATGASNKMLSYTSFIPILTKGMQEQQQQIEALKNEVAELKKLLSNK